MEDEDFEQLGRALKEQVDSTRAVTALFGAVLGMLVAKGSLADDEAEAIVGFAENTAGALGPEALKLLDRVREISAILVASAVPSDPSPES